MISSELVWLELACAANADPSRMPWPKLDRVVLAAYSVKGTDYFSVGLRQRLTWDFSCPQAGDPRLSLSCHQLLVRDRRGQWHSLIRVDTVSRK